MIKANQLKGGKTLFILSTGEIKQVPYPLDNTLINRGKAILVLDDAEDNA